MDKNSIFGILLIAAILITWGIVQAPDKKELAERQQIADSTRSIQRTVVETESLKVADSIQAPQNISIARDSVSAQNEYGQFASAARGTNKFFTIENDLIKMVVSSKGGRPYSVELKKYKTFNREPVVLFDGDSTIFGVTFIDNNKVIPTNDLYFTPADTMAHIATVKGDSLTMRLSVSNDRYMEYRYTLKPGSYMVDFTMNLVGMNDIVTQDPSALDLTWNLYIPQHEQEKRNENQYTSIYFRHLNEDVDFFRARQNKDPQEQNIPTQVEWVAYKNQFFASVLIAETAFTNARLKSVNLEETDKYLKNFNAEVGIPFDRQPNESIRLKMFFGPNKYKLLKEYKSYKLVELVSLGRGIIRWINQIVIIPIFDWLNRFIGNFGLIILLLTIIIKIGLLPLTYRSYLSQARMKVLKPQIDELTAKYPKGKELERQQATMALYKKAGISPMGGCLPMLLQFPILFAMFRFFPTSIELRQEAFLWATDLSTYDSIISWTGNIPLISSFYGNHVSLFTILMTVSTILQIKMSDTSSTQQMPGMKTMMYVMPVMFMFMLNRFSAGLTYYYFLANVITIAQNYLFKNMVDEKEILRKIEEKKAKPVKKSKWQQRLEAMSKQQAQKKPTKRK
jgi:YidC/Oxa1 family membrane protein insertase